MTPCELCGLPERLCGGQGCLFGKVGQDDRSLVQALGEVSYRNAIQGLTWEEIEVIITSPQILRIARWRQDLLLQVWGRLEKSAPSLWETLIQKF